MRRVRVVVGFRVPQCIRGAGTGRECGPSLAPSHTWTHICFSLNQKPCLLHFMPGCWGVWSHAHPRPCGVASRDAEAAWQTTLELGALVQGKLWSLSATTSTYIPADQLADCCSLILKFRWSLLKIKVRGEDAARKSARQRGSARAPSSMKLSAITPRVASREIHGVARSFPT